MTSTAPAKTAAAATTHQGAYTTLVKLLAQEVVDTPNPSPKGASNILLALGASQGDDATASTSLIMQRTRKTLLPTSQSVIC